MNNTQYLKEFLKYASLNVLGMIGVSCYILADTFFVSKGLGTGGLAALNLAIPVYSFIHGSGLMLGMGAATKFSIFKGQGAVKNTNKVFTNAVYLAAMMAVVFMVAGLFLSENITALFGADAEIFEMTNTYLRTILLFAPAFIMNDLFLCFVRNDGDPKLSMIAMVTGSLSNIVLDYVFIFWFNMGIFGAVFATGLAPLISLGVLSRHWFKKKNGFHFTKAGLDAGMVKSTVSLGFPSLIAEVSSGIVIIVFNFIILGLMGNVGVAAYGVIANISLVVVAVYTGIAQGIQPLISRAYGHNDTKNISLVLRYALISEAVVSVLVYLMIFFGADIITGVFNSENNDMLQQTATFGLRLYFLSAIFVGFNIIISMFFTSTEKALPAHFISLLRGLLLIIPISFLLSSLLGITGTWLAFPVTEMITTVVGISVYCFIRRNAKIKK